MKTTIARDWDERIVTVDRNKLIETLRVNRDKHRREYEEALAGYQKKTKEKLAAMYSKAMVMLDDNVALITRRIDRFDPEDQQDETIVVLSQVAFRMPVPRDHTRDYDVAIAMAEWEVNETIEVTQSQFQCFVLDDWEWQREFKMSNRLYSQQ